MYKENKISVVVPAYNEQDHILNVIDTVPDYVDNIIVVDDASYDNTNSLVRQHKNPKVTLIRNKKNLGIGGSIINGHEVALKKKSDINVVMAGDGQMDPDYLSLLLDTIIEQGYDYVKGNRFLHRAALKKMPNHRKIGNILITLLTKLASGYWQIFDPYNGYTAIKTKVLKQLNLFSLKKTKFTFELQLLVDLNIGHYRVKDVPIPALYGKEKSSLKLLTLIPKLSTFIPKSFFRRIFLKYFVYNFHPIAFFFISGIPLFLLGMLVALFILSNALSIPRGPTTGEILLGILTLMMGFQLILTAFILDVINEPK